MQAYEAPARTAVEQCLALKPDEALLVVTDDECRDIAEALYRVGQEVTDAACLIRSAPGTEHGAEPPAPIAASLRGADAFLAPTTKSLTHTDARRAATEAGVRGATLPGITEEVFRTGLDADYDSIVEECARLAAALASADEIRITAPAGTDLTLSVAGREWRRDTGIVHAAGDFSNLPAGEVFTSPVSADGVYVVDGTIAPHGRVEDPVRIEVADGYATSIDDPIVAERFERAAEDVGRDAYNVAELGIGTNLAVTELVGSVLLDEKAGGTVHVALGDDASIGGETTAPIHVDGIIRNPTVHVDGEELALPAP